MLLLSTVSPPPLLLRWGLCVRDRIKPNPGWQNKVLPATSDVGACPEMAPIADKYDDWVQRAGYPGANHYIVTRYANGDDNIGWHYDKPKSIAPGSLITVVKTGPHGRPFQLRDRVFFPARTKRRSKCEASRHKAK